MSEKDGNESWSERRTLGREGPESRTEGEWKPDESWVERHGEAETMERPDGSVGPETGIVDDGRTDVARRWRAGEVILGRYVVEGELGQGGMGVVYGCLDKVGGVRVAVKCLPPELGHNSVEMEEVRENFQLVYGLSHPNIAGVRQLERDGKGEYYLVMELAEGESLRRWLRGKWKAGGVSLAEAVAVLRQVASALDYAHGMKIVHRDVKPGNVMIDGKGRVKVLDFGLAAQIRTSLSRASHAYRGTSGTGPYMAPEQWRAQPQDAKTDQYALGVMAYEMLAGRLPFENPELAVLKDAVLNGEVVGIPGVPEGAMTAVRRAMAKRAEERFGSCGEFVEALEGKGMAGGAGGRRSARGRTLMGWAVVLAMLAGAIGAGVWWWRESGKGMGRLEGQENAEEETARPEGSPHQEGAQLEAEKSAEEERLAAEQAEKERRLDEQKATAEDAATLEGARLKELEEEVYLLVAEAKSKVEATAESDPGQGFGERLDEANTKLRQGEAAIQGQNFEKAKEWLEESLAAARWMEENAPLREEAVRARDAAVEAKEKADAVDGGRLNVPSYQTGNEWSTEGTSAFQHGRFKDATAAWNAAGEAYGQAETEARAAESGPRREEAVRVDNRRMQVRTPGAQVHSRPEASAPELGRVSAGDIVFVSRTEGGWAAISKPPPSVGVWLKRDFVDGDRVIAKSIQVRSGPGLAYDIVGTLQRGERALLLEESGDWWKISPPSSMAVWVREDRLQEVAESVLPPEEENAEIQRWEAQAGEVFPLDLGNGMTLEMVHCPGVAADFWMGKYEVTQEQWQQVMGKNPSYFENQPKNPVENVSWNDCQKFVKNINALSAARASGLVFRLPTEEEWETACRAGGYYYCELRNGTQITKETLSRVACYNKGWDDGPVAVGSFLPNAWGVYDMHGNVWEWTETAVGASRAVHGGSFGDEAGNCSAGNRFWSYEGSASRFLGLRLAASVGRGLPALPKNPRIEIPLREEL